MSSSIISTHSIAVFSCCTHRLTVLATVRETFTGLLLLGVGTQLEVLGTLDGNHAFVLALGAFQLQHDLLRGLGLLLEHRLRLTTETTLFAIVTTLTLSEQGRLTGLVLGDFVQGVLAASFT